MCFAEDGGHLWPYSAGKVNQQWVINGDRVQHRFNPNWVLAGSAKSGKATVKATNYSADDDLQMWQIKYTYGLIILFLCSTKFIYFIMKFMFCFEEQTLG